MKFYLGLILLGAGFVAGSVAAVTLEEVIGTDNVVTISPVVYKNLPVAADDANAVCALAGYQIVSEMKKKAVKTSYYRISSGGWGGPSIFGTFQFALTLPFQKGEVLVLEELTCARKYQSKDVKFE